MVRGRTRAAEPEAVEENGLNLKALKEKKISDLALIGKNFNIEGAANMRKQELIFAILQALRARLEERKLCEQFPEYARVMLKR